MASIEEVSNQSGTQNHPIGSVGIESFAIRDIDGSRTNNESSTELISSEGLVIGQPSMQELRFAAMQSMLSRQADTDRKQDSSETVVEEPISQLVLDGKLRIEESTTADPSVQVDGKVITTGSVQPSAPIQRELEELNAVAKGTISQQSEADRPSDQSSTLDGERGKERVSDRDRNRESDRERRDRNRTDRERERDREKERHRHSWDKDREVERPRERFREKPVRDVEEKGGRRLLSDFSSTRRNSSVGDDSEIKRKRLSDEEVSVSRCLINPMSGQLFCAG